MGTKDCLSGVKLPEREVMPPLPQTSLVRNDLFTFSLKMQRLALTKLATL
jgi:hypothetical protein